MKNENDLNDYVNEQFDDVDVNDIDNMSNDLKKRALKKYVEYEKQLLKNAIRRCEIQMIVDKYEQTCIDDATYIISNVDIMQRFKYLQTKKHKS